VSAEQPWLDDPVISTQPQVGGNPWDNDLVITPAAPPPNEDLFQPDTSGSRRLNARFNNPGALGLSDLGRSFGATASGVYDTGHPFAAFPTKEAGAAAQFALWQNKKNYLNHTLRDAITNWIGPGEHGEAEYISQKTGIPLGQPITDEFLRSPAGIRLMQAQAQYEGQNVLTPDEWRRAQDRAYNPAYGPKGSGIKQHLAEMASQIEAGQTPGPWDNDPVITPEAPRVATQKPISGPWDNDPVIAPQDVSPAPQNVPRGNIQQPEIQDGSKMAPPAQPKATPEATQWEPETQPPQDTPFDTVHKTVSNYWENAKQSAAQLNLAAQQGSAYSPTLPTDPIEQEIKRTQESTLLTDDQKAQTIAALRKGQTTVQANRMGAIVTEKANIAQAEAAKPDKAFQESFLGRASGMAGQATPYLASGAAGPMAPIVAATQMAAGAYGSAIDRSVQDAKRLHPDWSDAQLLVAANAAANESAKNAGAAGLALSLIPIPAAGPLIARMVEKWGLSAAIMVLAQQYARVQENVALKKNINPSQDLFEGLRENLGQDTAQALAFGLPHALGEIGRGGQRQPPAAEIPRPEEQPVPKPEATTETRPPEPQAQGAPAAVVEDNVEKAATSEPTPIEPPLVSSHTQIPAARYNGRIFTGTWHGDINAPEGAEYGYWDTAARKFIGPKEERDISAAAAQPVVEDSGVRVPPPEHQARIEPEGFTSEETQKVSAPTATDDERWVSAIANRFTEERSAAGEIGEIAPGVGYSRTDLREEGLKMTPEQIAQHVSDLMHNTGDPKLQAAAITAEEARLSQVSSRLSRQAEDQPGNAQLARDAESAFQDLTDFHNGPVAQLKNNWHAQGMTLQGEIPVDLSTFNGLREAWLRDVGKPTTPDVEATMRRTARNVRDAVTAENAALDQLGQKVESLKRAKIPSADEVRNNIMERLKDIPCVTR
jgi:hypothetical protein